MEQRKNKKPPRGNKGLLVSLGSQSYATSGSPGPQATTNNKGAMLFRNRRTLGKGEPTTDSALQERRPWEKGTLVPQNQ